MTIALVAAAILLFLAFERPRQTLPAVISLAAIALPTALLTAYFTVPFIVEKAYLSASPYLQTWKYDSFGARVILGQLLSGELFDYQRVPVMTVLIALGVASALSRRTIAALLALTLLVVWMLLYFGRPAWGALADLMPLHKGLLFHRFSGGVDLAAILLAGVGGEWIWNRCSSLPDRAASIVALVIIVLLMVPALRERAGYYAANAEWMDEARDALDKDADAAAIIQTLKSLPPGRTYVGFRSNWGNLMKWRDLHFWDLLAFYQIPALSPPYQSLSLNSDLIWHFDDNNAADYRLFNVKYVVAPSAVSFTNFFKPIKKTSRYTLYAVAGEGYAQLAHIAQWKVADSQSSLFDQSLAWMQSADMAASRFIRWSYMGTDTAGALNPWDLRGSITDEQVGPGRVEVMVKTVNPATLVFKMTYHPDWHVEIDGHEAARFMVSPSFIGTTVPAGTHRVTAVYRSNRLKNELLAIAIAVLLGLAIYGPRLARRLETFLQNRWPLAGE
jgi:hypothetical protein